MKRKARVYAPMKGFGHEESDYEDEPETEEVPRRRDPLLAASRRKNT